MVFLCSPVVSDHEALSPLGLALEDFAIHDSTVDVMRVLHSTQSTLTDLQEKTDLLRAERAALEAELRAVREERVRSI